MNHANVASLSAASRSKWQRVFDQVLATTGDDGLARKEADARTNASSKALRERLKNGSV